MAGEAVLCRDTDDGWAVFFLFSTVVLIAVILCCCFFASLAIFSFFFFLLRCAARLHRPSVSGEYHCDRHFGHTKRQQR